MLKPCDQTTRLHLWLRNRLPGVVSHYRQRDSVIGSARKIIASNSKHGTECFWRTIAISVA